jgi:transcriptional regulator GlxA family with amidase domain
MQIAILLYEGLTALDAVGPYEVLALLPGARVQFVAKEPGPKRTDSGFLSLTADYALGEVPRPDIVLVPGSSNSTGDPMRDRETLDWLRAAHETTRWTTSVCSGALVLAAAGLLRGRRAATHWAAAPHLAQFGAEYAAERFVEEGKIITAAGVSAGIDMALHLAARVAGVEGAQVIQLLTEYDPQPPFDAGSVKKATPEVVEQAKRRMAELAARTKAQAS